MIMNLEDKPFACDEKNCFMTFTNEDHLNSHKKKHSMSFTLEINSKNIDTADQTPTPTSFFRNCEEVGLFQDLQNVNPFEETFKKALESSENSTSKIESISDVSNDMLHTPHIFPNVEEPLHGKILDISDNEPLSVNLMEVPSLQVVSSENFLEKQADLRNKLKKALMKKDEIKNNQNLENNSSHTTGKLNINVNNNRKTKNAKTINSSNIERIREINRTAQMKCRVKKKMQMDIMTNDLLNLRKENLELKNENKRLRKNNIYLWKVIEDLGGNKESVMNKVKTFLENSLDSPTSPTEVPSKQPPLIAPAGSVLISKNASSTQPVIFSLVPVKILNTNTINLVPPLVTSTSSDVKRKKIVPRILRKT